MKPKRPEFIARKYFGHEYSWEYIYNDKPDIARKKLDSRISDFGLDRMARLERLDASERANLAKSFLYWPYI